MILLRNIYISKLTRFEMPVEIMNRKRMLSLHPASNRANNPANHWTELLARTCMNNAAESCSPEIQMLLDKSLKSLQNLGRLHHQKSICPVWKMSSRNTASLGRKMISNLTGWLLLFQRSKRNLERQENMGQVTVQVLLPSMPCFPTGHAPLIWPSPCPTQQLALFLPPS